MEAFATRTGVTAAQPPNRYLWTDAFAVCNFLGLHRELDQPRYLEWALTLVEQVHDVLGSYAEGDARSGWLGGAGDREHRLHPTRRGLRIGKKRRERAPSEPLDERLEWERDGQYFHYLTRWIHALEQVAQVTQDRRYYEWAVELLLAAHSGFVAGDPAGRANLRMYWKMDVDLSRPLVASMGQHDPLDGWITALRLRESSFAKDEDQQALARPIDAFHEICRTGGWATSDALGIGGLLTDAWRLDGLVSKAEDVSYAHIAGLLRDATDGLAWQRQGGHLEAPAFTRLAFRELGLAIGLHALERMRHTGHRSFEMDTSGLSDAFDSAARFLPLAERIERFWLDPSSQKAPTWNDHLDINSVMLASSLLPDGYLLSGDANR